MDFFTIFFTDHHCPWWVGKGLKSGAGQGARAPHGLSHRMNARLLRLNI